MTKSFQLIFIAVLAFIPVSAFAQFYDNHWMMGYNGGGISAPNDSFGVSILSFHEADMKIENNQEIDIFFSDSGTAFSTSTGDLSFFSNGSEIRSLNYGATQNGIFSVDFDDPSRIYSQSIVFLPNENNGELITFLRMTYTNGIPRLGSNLASSRINALANSGAGIVYEKNQIIVSDSLTTGEVTACKHANGRDWWVLTSKANEPLIYSTLVTPSAIVITDTIAVNFQLKSGLGQAIFSPNGNNYVRLNLIGGLDGEDYLDIFDFDRCTGELSNHRQTTVGNNAWAGGIAVSPSSQYLYVSHYNHVYQYDLWAEDIFESKDTVATWDGYLEWGFFHSKFYLAQLAVDGKIYINSNSGVKTLTVINKPDVAGEACNLAQHSIHLPNNNAFTLANHPNYRLGPIDGSPCDTLGLDNLPRAYFRADRSAADTLAFHFQDLSFYEPSTWHWSFGDGQQSNARHPDHVYAQPGIFEVCLTVSNAVGTGTHCRTLELGTVGLSDVATLGLSVFPNPVRDVLVLDVGDYYPLNGQFRMFDTAGRQVHHRQVLEKQVQMNVAHLPNGLYFYEFWDGGRRLGQGKVVKI